MEYEGGRIQFFDQSKIRLFGASTVFFDLGDSGALVFMPLNDDDELHCVGQAIGRTTYYSCLVTPIETVLQELGLDENSFLCFPVNSQ